MSIERTRYFQYQRYPSTVPSLRADGHLLARWRTVQPGEIAGVLAVVTGASA